MNYTQWDVKCVRKVLRPIYALLHPGGFWVKVNAKLIAETGDVREQLAELIRERVGIADDEGMCSKYTHCLHSPSY